MSQSDAKNQLSNQSSLFSKEEVKDKEKQKNFLKPIEGAKKLSVEEKDQVRDQFFTKFKNTKPGASIKLPIKI